MNAEFQRIVKGGKKAFLTEQAKKTIEENNRMGKKTGDIKGTTEQLNNNKAAKSQEEKKNKTGGIASCILHIDSLKNTASQF